MHNNPYSRRKYLVFSTFKEDWKGIIYFEVHITMSNITLTNLDINLL
jgi:hypothetical protein